MFKFFLLVLFTLLLSAEEYPKIFSSLGTPLYSALPQITKYEKNPLLQKDIQEYKRRLQELELLGHSIDARQNEQEIKNYLFE